MWDDATSVRSISSPARSNLCTSCEAPPCRHSCATPPKMVQCASATSEVLHNSYQIKSQVVQVMLCTSELSAKKINGFHSKAFKYPSSPQAWSVLRAMNVTLRLKKKASKPNLRLPQLLSRALCESNDFETSDAPCQAPLSHAQSTDQSKTKAQVLIRLEYRGLAIALGMS